MASSAIKNEEEKKEYFDPPEVLDLKIRKLAKYIRKSKYFIAFTGAGISTDCGIPDFRSGYNTVLSTGPGAWEELSQKKKPKKPIRTVQITEAIPSKTHMSFTSLLSNNLLKHVISQNVDGLHRKSGISAEDISELHGNIYIETCKTCGKSYLRDLDVVTSNCTIDHQTRNSCDNQICNGNLYDNIINFGENLDSKVIQKAFNEGDKADLCLAMGSSLRVNPAAQIPKKLAKRMGKLVIVNLQKTPLDEFATLVIHGFCDVVIEKLMDELKIGIPEFRLRRYLKVLREGQGVRLQGVEKDDSPFSFIRKLTVKANGERRSLRKDPFVIEECHRSVVVKLRFHSHYAEPSLELEIPVPEEVLRYMLEYNPFERTWTVTSI